jgi:hypothetical protein
VSLAFFSAVPARDLSCHHTCAHALDTTTETTTTITPNSKSGSRSQWSRPTQRAVTPKPLPQAHCARAITGTKPTRHSDGRGRGGAAHGGDGGDRRSHGGAVARAMWQRRVTGRLQTITTARNDRAKARYFNSLLLGYAGGGGGERRWQWPRVRAALWSAMAGAVLAAATCSPSGGGGSGGASYTRHRGRYVVRAVDLDPAVVRIFRPWALFFARARATGALGFAHTGQNHLGEGFWGAIAAQ